MPRTAKPTRERIVAAAIKLFYGEGIRRVSMDAVAAKAGVTKRTLYYHFKSKDELAIAAAGHFSAMADGLFATAPYHQAEDPLERLLGYVDFRAAILNGELPDYTCLLGTLVQETYDSHPAIRAACDQGMSSHIAALTRDVAAAKARYAPDAAWSAESVGYFIQAVLQGSFIFAKAKQNSAVIRENLSHLRRYLSVLFPQPRHSSRKDKS